MPEESDLRRELRKVEDAIALQESLRGTLPDGQLEAAFLTGTPVASTVVVAVQSVGSDLLGSGL